MLTLKEPIQLNSIRQPLMSGAESFGERIIGNYSLLGNHYAPKDLLYLLTASTELPEDLGGMTTLVNQQSHVDVRSVTLGVVNQVINRILLDGSARFTYQDQVYITNVLNRLGITNLEAFMQEVRRMKLENISTRHVTQLYRQELTRLIARKEKGEEIPSLPVIRAQEVEDQPGTAPEVSLSMQIFNRLDTARIYETLHRFQRHGNRQENYFQQNELKVSEQLRVGQEITLNQVKQQIFQNPQLQLFHHVNRYETGELLETPQTTEEVLSQAAAAALFNAIDHSVVQVLSRPQFLKNQWLHLENAIRQTAENTLSRYESFHQQLPVRATFSETRAETVQDRYVQQLREYQTFYRQLQPEAGDTRISYAEYPQTELQLTHAVTLQEEIQNLFEEETSLTLSPLLRQRLTERLLLAEVPQSPRTDGMQPVPKRAPEAVPAPGEQVREAVTTDRQETVISRETVVQEPALEIPVAPPETETPPVRRLEISPERMEEQRERTPEELPQTAEPGDIYQTLSVSETLIQRMPETPVGEPVVLTHPQEPEAESEEERLQQIAPAVQQQRLQQMRPEGAPVSVPAVGHAEEENEELALLQYILREQEMLMKTRERFRHSMPQQLLLEVLRTQETVQRFGRTGEAPQPSPQQPQPLELTLKEEPRPEAAPEEPLEVSGETQKPPEMQLPQPEIPRPEMPAPVEPVSLTYQQIQEAEDVYIENQTLLQGQTAQITRQLLAETLQPLRRAPEETTAAAVERTAAGIRETRSETERLMMEHMLRYEAAARAEEDYLPTPPVRPGSGRADGAEGTPAPVALTVRQAEEQAPELLIEELQRIDQQNRTMMQNIQQDIRQQTLKPPSVPDVQRTMQEALRALQEPEAVLREILEPVEAQMQHPALTPQEEAVLRQADPVNRAIYERILMYQKDPERALQEGLIRPASVGALQADLQQAAQDALELEHIQALSQEPPYILPEQADAILESFRRLPQSSRLTESPLSPLDAVAMVHKQAPPDMTEELLERLQESRQQTVRTVQDQQVTQQVIHQTDITRTQHQLVHQTTEDVTEMVNRTLARQMKTLSDQVYRQIERRLQSERSRRGRM